MDRRKKLSLILTGSGVLLALLVILPSHKKGDAADGTAAENVYTEIQDAEKTELTESKTDAYMLSSRNDIENYWDSCEDEYAGSHAEKDTSGNAKKDSSHPVTAAELFGSQKSRSSADAARDRDNPYREKETEREARHQRRKEEALDLAREMQGGQDNGEAAPENPVYESIMIPSGEVSRSGVISSLDGGWSDGNISSLDGDSPEMSAEEIHPIRCMFVRDEKVRSGQRVPIRLLEDIVINGILIPRNTHLMASCILSQRLELEVSNIEVHGLILTLGYEAYDTDGTRGIYCPDPGTAGQTVRSRGTNLAGSTLRSHVGRIAGDVVTTGVSLIESASGERTVSVPAGYTFFIVRKKQ